MHLTNIFIALCLGIFLYACRGSSNPLPVEDYIEINFPLNEETVYASSFVIQSGDSIFLNGLHIFLLKFTNKTETEEGIKYTGLVTSYSPLAPSKDVSSKVTTTQGEIFVTIKDNWVLYQYSDIYEVFNMFLKTATDTMDLPTQFENQFPSFPKKIVPFTQYGAFRPENSGLDRGYTGVYREFISSDFRSWSTAYSNYRGISITGIHQLMNINIEMDMIIDEKGIVISQLFFGESYITNEQGVPLDTVSTYLINQRLVDYTGSDIISPLSYYADQLLSNEISLLSGY
jgi:hypothetical protein